MNGLAIFSLCICCLFIGMAIGVIVAGRQWERACESWKCAVQTWQEAAEKWKALALKK